MKQSYKIQSDYDFWTGFGKKLTKTKTTKTSCIYESLFHMYALDLFSGVSYYFHEAVLSLKRELYIASLLSFINGIEASLRRSCCWLHPEENDISRVGNFGISLLKRAHEKYGLPIHLMRMKKDTKDVITLLKENKKPEIVVIRNYICHGNTSPFAMESGIGNVFVPKMLKDIVLEVADLSARWVHALTPAIYQHYENEGHEIEFETQKSLIKYDLNPIKHNILTNKMATKFEKLVGLEKTQEIFKGYKE